MDHTQSRLYCEAIRDKQHYQSSLTVGTKKEKKRNENRKQKLVERQENSPVTDNKKKNPTITR